MQSRDAQLLTSADGQVLTGEYAPTRSRLVKSRSSLQFEVLYEPDETPADTVYLDMFLQYTNEVDIEARTGITEPAEEDWLTYKEEQDDGAGVSIFVVRHWKIVSTDDVDNLDLSAVFARPLLASRIRLQIKEFGTSNFGTAIIRSSVQAI